MQNNPILNQINNQRNQQTYNKPQIQMYKNLWHQIQTAPNPQQAFENIMNQNPDVRQVLNMVKSSHGNLEQLARYMADKRGIDLNELVKELQS